MAWTAVTNLPFVPVGTVYFSQIIGVEFYVIDQGFNFYKCNIGTGVWTHLANPPYDGANLYRQLTYRNGMLYCIMEGGVEPRGRRIGWYNPTTNTWASSSQVVSPIFNYVNIRSFCFADDDTIWAWAKRTAFDQMKCVRYVISTDIWTEFANNTGVLANNQARSAAINAVGTMVYASQMGAFAMSYGRYTIATDAYWQSGAYAGYNWVWSQDPLRLWYVETGGAVADRRYGYFDIATLAFNSNYWAANPAQTSVAFIGSDLRAIVQWASAIAPEIYWNGQLAPTVQTDAATSIVSNSASLNGTLVTGAPSQCYFEWGETPAYGNVTPIQNIAVDGSFAYTIGPLKPNTTYYFRAVATNDIGTDNGVQRSFTTTQVPYYPSTILPQVQTNPATLITQHTARLNGEVIEDGGVRGDTRFQWGLTTDYGNITPWRQGDGKGDSFFANLTNLAEGAAFHFRAQFRNRGTIYNGSDMTFNTLSPLGPVTLVTDELIYLLEAV